MKKRIVIVGSSFAGYSVAITLSKLLEGAQEIIVIDESSNFMFLPSLVWYPFGYRNSKDISFDIRPIYLDLGIQFIETRVYGFDVDEQIIYTSKEDISYDYLVIATGTKPNYNSIKGLIPSETTWSISNIYDAKKTRLAWKEFLQKPGPLVIGAAQWAGYFFTAYEFLLNALSQLKDHRINDIPIHFITAEPYLAHFGLGGNVDDTRACEELFTRHGVIWHTNAEIHDIKEHLITLENGMQIETDFSMIIPQFIGVDAVRTTRKFATPFGFILVNDRFQHIKYQNIYGAGGAVSIPQTEDTFVPCGVPRTNKSTRVMAKTVAYNIFAELEGASHISIPTSQIYEYSREDMGHLGSILFGRANNEIHDLDFIKKGTQEKWANSTIEQFIEASFEPNYLKI